MLLPPVACAAVGVALTAAVDAFALGSTLATAASRASAIVLPALVSAALAACWARANRAPWGLLVAAAVAVLLASGAAAMVPGVRLPLVEVALAAAVAFVAPLVGRRWTDVWMRRRVVRVSLLSPTTLSAADAVARLDAVPWVRVSSAVVPDADPATATRLLHRPVDAGTRGGIELERRVIVSCPMRDPAVGRAIAELVARGHDLTSESSVLRDAEGRVDTSRADPLNLLMCRPRSRFLNASSRLLDIVGSLVLLGVAAPVLLACAVAVAAESGFPVLYRQRRVGRGGRPFDVLKFRSMRKDAERVSGPVWATEGDPRITRVGRFLRRYRLDELPQLWNVLVGEMALVGPRPERPHFCDALREQVPLFELRTIVRPGLTGWAQVRLAYASTADDARDKLEYDLYYVTHRSPWFDLAILAETARVVLTGAGSR